MKLVLKIFNLVYIVLAAVACVALFTTPLVTIDASLSFSKQQVTDFSYPNFESYVPNREDFDNAFNKSLDENGRFVMKLNVNIPAGTAISKDPKGLGNYVADQVSKNTEELIQKLNPTVKELARIIAKKEGHESIKSSIANQIEITNPGQSSQIMENCHIDDQYIDGITDHVLDALLGTDTTEPVQDVDALMGVISNDISDVCRKLSEGNVPGYEPDTLDEKIKTMNDSVKTDLKKALEEAKLCDENGKINNTEAVIEELLASVIDGLLEGSGEGNESRSMVLRTTEEEAESKLNAKIRELINKKLEEYNIVSMVEQFWYIPLIFIFILVLPWAFFIIVTLIRTIRRKKIWTKPWFVFVFAAIQLVLGIVLFLAVGKFMGQLLNLLPIPESPTKDMLANSSLIIETCTFIPSILYLVMIPLTIAYIIIAHKIKKDYKQEKRGKKAA